MRSLCALVVAGFGLLLLAPLTAHGGVAVISAAPPPGSIPPFTTYTVTETWSAYPGQIMMGQTLYAVAHCAGPPPFTTGPSPRGTYPSSPAIWNLQNQSTGVSVSVYSEVGWFGPFGSGVDRSQGLGPWNS